MTTPTLINLPPPPSDPVTPSDIPGTPNSTTTSMSELSTVAIKDGHRGHPHHHSHRQQASTSDNPDAERADRISRLAGLERVATVRQASNSGMLPGALAGQSPGYFEHPTAQANTFRERSTVGSASATGSVGGRTTWASGSNAEDATDKMSEDQEMDASSVGGFSDEGNASLVGFGEGASSTTSGPISTPGNRMSQRQSQQYRAGGSGITMPQPREPASGASMLGVTPTGPRQEARPTDSPGPDQHMADSTPTTATRGEGAEAAEQIMRDRSFTASNDGGLSKGAEQQHDQRQLGRFNFE